MIHTKYTNDLARYRPALQLLTDDKSTDHRQRIIQELKALGVSSYGLLRSEMRELAAILHEDERIKGVVYGKHTEGFAVLTATDRRVLFIDKKPLFLRADEITYELVGGITYGKIGPWATITLHTRIGDYTIRTMNFTSAQYFITFIELRCLEQTIAHQERS